MKIKTPSDLKYAVEQAGHEPHFFTRETMKFFGDTMANFSVRKTGEINGVMCYELSRKRAVKHGLNSSYYFNAETFKRVRP